jgi:hypothetical protein
MGLLSYQRVFLLPLKNRSVRNARLGRFAFCDITFITLFLSRDKYYQQANTKAHYGNSKISQSSTTISNHGVAVR